MKNYKKHFALLPLFIFLFLLMGCAARSRTISYSVIFDSDGGTIIEQQKVAKGGKVAKPTDPIKEGYIFLYWELDGAEYDFDTLVTGNLTLTAKWEEEQNPGENETPDNPGENETPENPGENETPENPNEGMYTVKFNTDGGNAIPDQLVNEGDLIVKPEDPIKEGYKFLGWYFNSGQVKWDFDNFAVNIDVTLTAKWQKDIPYQPNEYTVKFNSDGGTAIDNIKLLEGEKINKPADPEKAGYTFIGWYHGTKLWDFDTFTVTGNIILTAKWEESNEEPTPTVTYTVTFNSNGGSNVQSQTVSEGGKASEPLKPNKTGFEFVGWYKDGVMFDFNTIITESIELEAVWEEKYYTVTFNTDGAGDVESQSILSGLSVEKPDDPEKEGYIFIGWYINNLEFNFNSLVYSDIELVAKWEAISYTVTFNSDGGTIVTAQIVNYNGQIIEPENPEKEGYIFNGWYFENSKWDFSTIVTQDITLTAKWLLEENLEEKVVSSVYISLTTKTYTYSSNSIKYTAQMRDLDYINIIIDITLADGYEYSDDVILYVNNVAVSATTYKINGNVITYTIDDPNWSPIF